MAALISINKKEAKIIGKRASLVEMDYDPKTVQECEALYRKAPEIAEIAKLAVKDGLQGKALLEAKKLICGDEWELPTDKISGSSKKEWKFFLQKLNLLDKKGFPSRNVSYLLEYAGYKERGGEIEIASHYREVKKLTGATNKEPEKIDKAYQAAGGKELKTAKEVKQKVAELTDRVDVYMLFEKTSGLGRMPEAVYAPLAFPKEVMKRIPTIPQKDWKSFYRKTAACLHPDKGGSPEDMDILARLNEMMQIVFEQLDSLEKKDKWYKQYVAWKEKHGIASSAMYISKKEAQEKGLI